MSSLVEPLVRYADLDPWEVDTRSLPRPLARHRRAVRRFAETHLAPVAERVDQAPHGPVGIPSADVAQVLAAAGRAGLFSDLLPAPFGSADPRFVGYPLYLPPVLATEELAAVDGGLMLLVSAHKLGVAPLLLSGDLGAVRRFVLPAFRESLAGRPHLFAFAITEPEAGSDVEESHGASLLRPGTVAREVAGGFLLSGRKCYISGGDLAQSVVTFAALAGRGVESWTAFLVPRSSPGFRVTRTELKMGMRASGAAELAYDDVFVPHAQVIGGVGRGWALNRATLNMSRIPVAAMGVGFARAATESAITFACEQTLGGRPLVAYQDVQVALADMLIETQAARATAWRVAERRVAIQRDASAAKVFCTDTALRVCTRAMDLLGNHAVLPARRVERVLRDARLTQIFEGTNQINRLAVIEDEQERLLDTIARLRADGSRP